MMKASGYIGLYRIYSYRFELSTQTPHILYLQQLFIHSKSPMLLSLELRKVGFWFYVGMIVFLSFIRVLCNVNSD